MTKYPRILIIDHEKNAVKNLHEIPVIDEISQKVPGHVHTICEESLLKVLKGIPDVAFDVVITDIFFPGQGLDEWGKLLAKELINREIPIIVYSSHLLPTEIIILVNEYRISGILHKNEEVCILDKILRDLISNRLRYPFALSPSKAITWLHISDLHFGSPEDPNRTKVENAFFKDIERFMKSGISFQMIIITGDIAYHGKKEEYDLAAKFIDKLLSCTGISKEGLFIVPGNHDINQNSMNNSAKKLCAIKNREDIRNIIDNKSTRDILLEPLQEYSSFIKELGLGTTVSTNDDLSFSGMCMHASLGIAGINSTFGSGVNTDSTTGKIKDKGNIFVGETQVERTVNSLIDPGLKIAMMHHPLSYLSDHDTDVEKVLQKQCNILLHGHLHKSEFKKIGGIGGNLAVIPVGSLYQGRELVNSYNIATVDFEQYKIVVQYRRYSDMQQEFVKDLDTTGEKLDGCYKFSFSKKMGC
jgi:3',5'-cyclic AMP phosphodiesterase CpdA